MPRARRHSMTLDVDPSDAAAPPNVNVQLMQEQDSELSKVLANDLQDTPLRDDDFERLKTLGFGNGGSVAMVRHKLSGGTFARKIIHLELKPGSLKQILRELDVLRRCNSPCIVKSYGSFVSDGEISIVMEYMDVGSLDKVLARVGRIADERVLARIADNVIRGLCYLREELNMLHRDVKPSNMLINSSGHVKLCDFGVSGELSSSLELANTFIGTRSYMAPERLLGVKSAVASDVWSLGISLIELATGYFPILNPHADLAPVHNPPLAGLDPPPTPGSEISVFDLLASIVEGEPPKLPESGHFGDEIKDFTAACLIKSSSERPTPADLLDHPLLTWAEAKLLDMAEWAASTLPPEGSENGQADDESFQLSAWGLKRIDVV